MFRLSVALLRYRVLRILHTQPMTVTSFQCLEFRSGGADLCIASKAAFRVAAGALCGFCSIYAMISFLDAGVSGPDASIEVGCEHHVYYVNTGPGPG